LAKTLTQIGKYRIERELGRGAMGVVYKAFDPDVERNVAIKTMRLDVESSDDVLNRMRREAKSVGQLEDTNIVTLYEAGESNGLFYLAMQFIEGETLQDRIERQKWFTLKEILDLFAQICSGLDYAHSRGVVHRDIKPANIMITKTGVVKLTDFGIAKLAGGGGTSTSGLIVGTPSYMSPEQAVGKPLDGRSDIFSLGSILYELLTGEKAFPGQNVTTVMYKIVHESPTPVLALQPGLDPGVEPIVLRALAKNPDARFQSCREFAQALQEYVSHSVAGNTIAASPKSLHSPRASTFASSGGPSVSASVPGMPAAPQTMHGADQGAAATGPARTGKPLAWLAIGALGSLLSVVIVMLVLQMRKPAQVAAPPPSKLTSGPVTTSPTTPPPGSSSGSIAANPGDKPQTPADTQQSDGEESKTGPASHGDTEHSVQHVPQNPPAEIRPPTHGPGSQSQKVIPPSQTDPPETVSSLILKGDIAYQQGHYENALASYKKAYQMDSKSAKAKRMIGVVLTLLNRPEEASKYR